MGGAFKRPPPPPAGGGKSRGPAGRGLNGRQDRNDKDPNRDDQRQAEDYNGCNMQQLMHHEDESYYRQQQQAEDRTQANVSNRGYRRTRQDLKKGTTNEIDQQQHHYKYHSQKRGSLGGYRRARVEQECQNMGEVNQRQQYYEQGRQQNESFRRNRGIRTDLGEGSTNEANQQYEQQYNRYHTQWKQSYRENRVDTVELEDGATNEIDKQHQCYRQLGEENLYRKKNERNEQVWHQQRWQHQEHPNHRQGRGTDRLEDSSDNRGRFRLTAQEQPFWKRRSYQQAFLQGNRDVWL